MNLCMRVLPRREFLELVCVRTNADLRELFSVGGAAFVRFVRRCVADRADGADALQSYFVTYGGVAPALAFFVTWSDPEDSKPIVPIVLLDRCGLGWIVRNALHLAHADLMDGFMKRV